MDLQIIQITSHPPHHHQPTHTHTHTHTHTQSLANDSLFVTVTHPSLGLIKNNSLQSWRTVMMIKRKREFWLTTLKRRHLTCSCSVNACREVLRRRLNIAHLGRPPPCQCYQGGCGVGAARTVRRCAAVPVIISSLRKEVNEAVCWSERKTAGAQKKLLFQLMSRRLRSPKKDIWRKNLKVV